MARPYLTVAAVIAVAALLEGANGLLSVLLPLRMSAAQFPLQMIGWVSAAYGAGLLLGWSLIGRLVVAVGPVRAFAVSAATLALVTLALAAFREPLAWLLLRLVGGACMAGLMTLAERWMANCTPPLLRSRVLGVYIVCAKVALVCAPLALVPIGLAGPWAFVLAGALSLSTLPLCTLSLLPVTTRSANPTTPGLGTLCVRALYRNTPEVLAGCLSAGMLTGALLSLVPIYGEGVGLDLGQIVLLFPALQLGSLMFQWPLGWWSDRGDRRLHIAGIGFAVGAVSLAIGLLGTPGGIVLMSMLFLLGGLSLSLYAICLAHAGDHAKPDQMASRVSTLLLTWGVGATIGPALAAAVMDRFGVPGLFYYVAAVAFPFAEYVLWRIRWYARAPDEDHVHFVNLTTTSPAAVALVVAAAIGAKANDDAADLISTSADSD